MLELKLSGQTEHHPDAVRAFNVACVEQKGFEADDIIATYAREAVELGGVDASAPEPTSHRGRCNAKVLLHIQNNYGIFKVKLCRDVETV